MQLTLRVCGPPRSSLRFGGGINHPRAPYPKLLCRVFNATAEELGLVPPSPSSTASITTLNRRFREQASTTPLQRLRRARVRHAHYLLESTTHPVDRIAAQVGFGSPRSEEHTSELQSQSNLVCRLLLEKKKKKENI